MKITYSAIVSQALDKCQLGDLVGAKEEKLDSTGLVHHIWAGRTVMT